MVEALMAKKKADKPARRLSVQASEAWVAWVDKGAAHCLTDVSKLVDVAITQYLRAQGFEDKPPKRVP